MPNTQKLYNDLNSFLRDKFGGKVYKVSIDAGFTCPNLDGKISKDGCIFCNNESIFPKGHDRTKEPIVQLEEGIEYIKKRHKADKFIAYLQPFSNTYASLGALKKIYDPLIKSDQIVALAASTRPDCVNDEVLDYLETLQREKYLWLELGLQSSHSGTLKRINRGHSYGDFLKAFGKATERRIDVCVHIILGLPEETPKMMIETVKKLSTLGIFGIKMHSLHVLKNTKLCEEYLKGDIKLMDLDSYVNTVVKCLEVMDPKIVIHRLTGEGPKELTVAPNWVLNKLAVLNAVKAELLKKGSYQGIKFEL